MISFLFRSLTARFQRVLLFTLIALLAACSGDEEKEDPFKDWTAKDFYIEAKNDLRLAEFEAAIKKLETLEARYPFSNYAKQAQLDVAYAYYKFEEADSAISAADRFRRLHPTSPHIDYVIYLRGLANFYRGVSLLDSMFPRNVAEHDPKNMKEAMKDFITVIRRYPGSIYAPDAYLRSIFLRNKLAEGEIIAAEYYIQREAWVSAINRAQNVIQLYQTAPARDRAIEIMILGYEKLGMTKLAEDMRRIQAKNPPKPVEKLTEEDKAQLEKTKTPEVPAQ